MIYHIKINQKDFEVDSDTTVNAIKLALDEFESQASEDPDNCDTDTSTQGIYLLAEVAGELVSST